MVGGAADSPAAFTMYQTTDTMYQTTEPGRAILNAPACRICSRRVAHSLFAGFDRFDAQGTEFSKRFAPIFKGALQNLAISHRILD